MRLVRLAVCVVLIASVTGCVGTAAVRLHSAGRIQTRRRSASSRRVVFAGDSITSSARQQIEVAATTHGYTPYVYAFPGLTSAEINVELEKAHSEHHGVYATVLNAGTNDVHLDVGRSWKRSYESLLSRATTPCVVLTTVSDRLDAPRHAPRATTINAYIRKVERQHENVRVVDWNAEILSGAPFLLPDGIHPAAAGRRWIAAQDIAALRSCER